MFGLSANSYGCFNWRLKSKSLSILRCCLGWSWSPGSLDSIRRFRCFGSIGGGGLAYAKILARPDAARRLRVRLRRYRFRPSGALIIDYVNRPRIPRRARRRNLKTCTGAGWPCDAMRRELELATPQAQEANYSKLNRDQTGTAAPQPRHGRGALVRMPKSPAVRKPAASQPARRTLSKSSSPRHFPRLRLRQACRGLNHKGRGLAASSGAHNDVPLMSSLVKDREEQEQGVILYSTCVTGGDRTPSCAP